MKKIVLLTLALMFVVMSSGLSFAQGKYGADSANCIKYLSYYKEYYKQKNYAASLPNWRKAFKICPPTASQNMLIDGTNLLRREIAKNATNLEYKKALLDTLLSIHDIRAEYYPKYAVTSRNNKGLDIINYLNHDNNVLHTSLSKIIEENGVKVKTSILLLDFKAAIELFKEGKLTAEDVLNTYQKTAELMSNILKSGKDVDALDVKIKEEIESLFITSKVASCEELIALFTPRFEANPNDMDLISNIVKILSVSDNCTDNDLYLKAVTAMYNNNPSSQAAYFLYKLHSSKNNKDESIKYLEEAINAEDVSPLDKANYQYELAVFCLSYNMYVKAINAAKQAVALDSALAGKSYYLIGTIWSSLSCDGDEIAKRAKYWVATDYMLKAKAADSSLSSDCNEMINKYKMYYPAAADAFMYNLTAGNSYTVSCSGLKVSTTVRTQE